MMLVAHEYKSMIKMSYYGVLVPQSIRGFDVDLTLDYSRVYVIICFVRDHRARDFRVITLSDSWG